MQDDKLLEIKEEFLLNEEEIILELGCMNQNIFPIDSDALDICEYLISVETQLERVYLIKDSADEVVDDYDSMMSGNGVFDDTTRTISRQMYSFLKSLSKTDGYNFSLIAEYSSVDGLDKEYFYASIPFN